MIEQVLSPFQFEFFVNGLVVATLAGALCGLIGVYVVLRGMSYIGHGLSHAIFGGFAANEEVVMTPIAASAAMMRRRVTCMIIIAEARPQAPAPM